MRSKKGKAIVLRDEIIELEYNPEDESGKKQTKVTKRLRLRKVCYQDEQNRYDVFLTNCFEITAEEVAFLCKKRWGIELLVKKMKTNYNCNAVNDSLMELWRNILIFLAVKRSSLRFRYAPLR
jgi:IS4 transposase